MLRVGPALDLRDNTTCQVFNDFRCVMMVMLVMIMIMIVTMIMIMMMMIITTTMIIFSANQHPSCTSTRGPLLKELSLKISLMALLSEIAHTGDYYDVLVFRYSSYR